MTNEDLMLHITAIRVCARKEIERINRESRIDEQKMLNEWAKEHARFSIGDVLNSLSVTIRVEKIVGRLGIANKPYVEYQGHALTKKLQECANRRIAPIYDDGNPNRPIIKINR